MYFLWHTYICAQKSSVVCKKTATPKTRQHVPATVSPTTELSSKLAGVEFFQGDSPSSQVTSSPRKSPLKEIQDTCSVESVQLSPAADQEVEDDVCTSATSPVVHQKMNSPGRPLDTEVPILSVATEGERQYHIHLHQHTHIRSTFVYNIHQSLTHRTHL